MRAFSLLSILCLIGCDGGESDTDAGREEIDAGRDVDAGREEDAGREDDAGMSDAGMADAGMPDGGMSDAGMDAGMDAGPACGAGAVDQSQLDGSSGGIDIEPTQNVGQTFTVGATGRLSGIEIAVVRGMTPATTDRLVLTVFDMAGTNLGSASIATSSIDMSGNTASNLAAGSIGPAFFDLCEAAIDVTAGTVLRYVVTRTGTDGVCTMAGPVGTCTAGPMIGSSCADSSSCNARVLHSIRQSDVYAGGTAEYNGTPFAGDDVAFKTFVY
jgi:hypothetical protein